VTSGVWDRQRATMEHNLRRLHAAGVPIAMGTDAGNPGTAHGPSVYREMEAMQAAGMSAADVFRASTLTAAQAMGLEREMGTIEPGKRADLLLLSADPLEDIRNTSRIDAVVVGGRWLDREERERMIAAAAERLGGEPPKS
jgi:imidazolonepropionase-like amidohydrolase